MNCEIIIADYSSQKHAQDILCLLNHYAMDSAGGGKALSRYAQENLITELNKLPFAFSLIAYINDTPIALSNCFTLFSTFQCKPIINIHDLVVLQQYRKQGISQLLLGEVEKIARAKGACKITLEVLEKNYPAKNSYAKFGFVNYELNPEYGKAVFLEKIL